MPAGPTHASELWGGAGGGSGSLVIRRKTQLNTTKLLAAGNECLPFERSQRRLAKMRISLSSFWTSSDVEGKPGYSLRLYVLRQTLLHSSRCAFHLEVPADEFDP